MILDKCTPGMGIRDSGNTNEEDRKCKDLQ